MKNQLKKIVFAFLLVAVLFACEQHPLTDSKVLLLSPPNHQNDSILSKVFWWQEVTGAKNYQLQIVSPTFDSVVSLVLDSTMTQFKFSKSLTPGNYQWRVRALNGTAETEYTTYSFVIKNTESLTGQSIANMSPAKNYATNNLVFDFSWDAMAKATSYLFKIRDSIGNVYVVNTSVTTNTYKNTLTTDGYYKWSVQALNSSSASFTGGENTLVIDRVAPSTPSLTWPNSIAHQVPTTSKIFQWSDGTLSGSAISDSIWIGSDSVFQVSPVVHVIPALIGGSSYTITDVELAAFSAGKMYWRVRSKDAAGNVGPYSAVKSFTKK